MNSAWLKISLFNISSWMNTSYNYARLSTAVSKDFLMTPRTLDSFPSQGTDHVAGCEWIIDAGGCTAELLRSLETLQGVCERVVRELELQVVGSPLWRQFPEPGGVTGLCLLTESHLACHTWPEHGVATFNLFCCHRRREWAWESRLREMLLAETVTVRMVERGRVWPCSSPVPLVGGTT